VCKPDNPTATPNSASWDRKFTTATASFKRGLGHTQATATTDSASYFESKFLTDVQFDAQQYCLSPWAKPPAMPFTPQFQVGLSSFCDGRVQCTSDSDRGAGKRRSRGESEEEQRPVGEDGTNPHGNRPDASRAAYERGVLGVCE
jgi:hypothetical protein